MIQAVFQVSCMCSVSKCPTRAFYLPTPMIPSITGYGGICCTNVQTVFQKFIEDTLEQKFPDYYLYTSFHYVAQ